MQATLYHIPKTVSSPLVQLLWELGAADTFVRIQEVCFSDMKKSWYTQINPMGTSPAFQEGQITMYESGAILDLLLETFDTSFTLHPAPLAYQMDPSNRFRRASYLQIKQFLFVTVYPELASLFLHTLKPPKEQDDEYVRQSSNKFTLKVAPVLARWLGDKPFFLGEMSSLDFIAAKPLGNAAAMGLLKEFPTLCSLLEKIQSRPTYKMAYTSTQEREMENGNPPLVSSSPVKRHAVEMTIVGQRAST